MDAWLQLPSILILARRRFALLLTVSLCVMMLSLLVSFLVPVKYSSTMSILIRSSARDIALGSDETKSSPTGQVSEEEVNSEVELLTGYDVLQQAVIENHLSRRSSFSSKTEQEQIEAAVRKLAKSLQVTPVRKANIIEISYEAKSPQLAASVLRSIEKGYLQTHLRAQSTPGGYAFFTNQAQRAQQVVDAANAQLSAFDTRENVVDLPQEKTLLTQALVQMKVELLSTSVHIAELKSEITASLHLEHSLASRVMTTEQQGPNQYSIDHLTSSLADLQNKRTLLASKFREGDPFLKEIDIEIQQTASALAAAKQSSVLAHSSDINPALQALQVAREAKQVDLHGYEAREDTLRKEIAASSSNLDHLTRIAGTYAGLATAADQAQRDLKVYAQRREEERVAEQLSQSKITNVIVAQQPTESYLPVQSRGLLNIALSVVLGFLAGMVAVVLSEVTTLRRRAISAVVTA